MRTTVYNTRRTDYSHVCHSVVGLFIANGPGCKSPGLFFKNKWRTTERINVVDNVLTLATTVLILLTYEPTPGQVTSCYLDAIANPSLGKPSAVDSKFDNQSWRTREETRTIAYVAEAGMNLAIGNGFLYGLRGVPDVPPDVEVKWSRRGDKLIVPDKYWKPNLRYVLATGTNPITYLGWLPGSKITKTFRSNAAPTWFAYSNELQEFTDEWWPEKIPENITIGQAMSHPSAYP